MAFRPTLEKKEEKDRVRAALLRAALHLGALHGFASLGLREVAREAGIAPTSFYRHFADMEELGRTLVRELVSQVLRTIEEHALAAQRGALVASLVDTTLQAVADDPELMRFLVAERLGAFAALRTLLRAELSSFASALHTALSRGSPEAPPPLAAELSVGILLEGCVQALDASAPHAGSVREALVWALSRVLGTPAQERSHA
jgi:AcrR family transcriptional regulator